jgi:arylsulfatase A-like enzyme
MPGMSVLLLLADGLPASWIGPYGNEWVETPHLDLLAAEGVVADWHFAPHPDPAGSADALHGRFTPTPDRSLVAELATAGVAGRLVHAARLPVAAALAAHWPEVVAPLDLLALFAALRDGLDWLADGERRLLTVAVDWLLPPWSISPRERRRYFGPDSVDDQGRRPRPWRDPPVGPLDEPEGPAFDDLRQTFAAAVSRFDRLVGRVRRELMARGLLDAVTWVVASGRGQALGADGVVGPCRPWLAEEVVHVPLLIRRPGAAEAGRRLETLTATPDVSATVCGLLGVPVPGWSDARDVLAGGPGRPYVPLWGSEGGSEWGLRLPDWSVRVPEGALRPSLYRQPEDRWQVNDLGQQQLEWAEALASLRPAIEAAVRGEGEWPARPTG